MAWLQGRWWFSLCLLAGSASAAERPQWLPFMGGEESQAHAIHLAVLKQRPDGLLESASRYPRTSAAGWTAEQNERGWYEYLERLVDCETGLYVDTALSLLDKDSRPVARRETSRDDQLQQIALTRSDVAGHRWPGHSEIWMACAAGRDPAVGADVRSAMTENEGRYAYDYQAIGDAPPPDGDGLFSRLRAQYEAELARYSLPSRAPAGKSAAAFKGERWATVGNETQAWDLAGLRHRGAGIVEASQRAGYDPRRPPEMPEDADVRVDYKIDCRNGLIVPVTKAYYAPGSERLLQRVSTPVFDTLNSLSSQAQWGGDAWTPWLGPQLPGPAAMLCTAAAARCNGGAPRALASVFEIDPESLPPATGAPLLLAARARWLAHRDGFVPSCPIGAL